MGMQPHFKEIRERIVTTLRADLAAFPQYVIADRYQLIKGSNTTAYVQFQGCGPTKRALNELCLKYEYHVFVGVLHLDADAAQDLMDDFLNRAAHSLDSHPNLDAFITGGEEVFKCRVGGGPNDIDMSRGQDAANNYVLIARIKVFVETNQRGV